MTEPFNPAHFQSPPRVLALAQYPIARPKHGGQARMRGLVDALVAVGCEVQTLCAYPDFGFPLEERDPSDLVIASPDFSDTYYADPLFGDVLISMFILERPLLLADFQARYASFSPDLIWLEQPFLYPVIREVQARLGAQAPIIYSSANNEYALKQILIDMPRGPGIRDLRLLEATREIERDCVAAAHHIVAINDEEAEALRAEGKAVSYLPASSLFDFANSAASALFEKRKAMEKVSYLAYAASAYWLNVDGFFDLFEGGLGFLRPNERIWVSGSGGEAIQKDFRYARYHALNESRFSNLGFLPDRDLPGFLMASNAVIVPVPRGGGSNLKTADAIASGRPVIVTPKGISGFRSIAAPALGAGVYVAESPRAFKELCRAALQGGLQAPPEAVSVQFRTAAHEARLRAVLQGLGVGGRS